MRLDEIGVWIKQDGTVIDVYGSEYLTHAGWAMAHGSTIEDVIRKGFIRVSMGDTFHFLRINDSVLGRIRKFIGDRMEAYEGRTVTIMTIKGREWEIPVSDILSGKLEWEAQD